MVIAELKIVNNEHVNMNVAVDISCTFDLGLCGWLGNWTHDVSRDSSLHSCQLLAAGHFLFCQCL